MLGLLRVAAAAMSAEQARVDLVAHNLANAQTVGFHRLVVALRSGEPRQVYRRDAGVVVGTRGSAPSAPQGTVDLRPAVPVPTGDPQDLAVEGGGFVLLEGGRLTSGGRLGVDVQGFLTLAGVRVQGADGPVRVSGLPRVRSDGQVEDAGRVVGRLRIVRAALGSLSVSGPGVYTAPANALQDAAVPVRQGARAQPATNPVEELVQLIAGSRAYEAAARCVQVADEVASRLAEVARL